MATFQKINKLVKLPSEKYINWTNLLIISFFFFSLVGILNHEMWFDELQAWMIARDSSSWKDLYQNLRYEGHPWLWHSFLYIITKFTHDPLAMQVLHVLIATVAIFLFTKFSPFTNLQKVLFSFGYFPAYEYNVISRNYGLGVLLVFLFCTFFPERQKSYWRLSVILAFLANTNAYGWIISICLALTLLIDKIFYKKDFNELHRSKKQELIISSIIFILGIVSAAFQMLPPADAKFQGDSKQEFSTKNYLNFFLFSCVTTIWKSYVPLPNIFNYNFWGSNILTRDYNTPILLIFALLLSLALFLFGILIFVRKPIVLFLYLSGTCAIILFGYVKFLGTIRHHGHLFILFIACLWISDFYSSHSSYIVTKYFKNLFKVLSQHKKHYINILLIIHLLAGIFAYSMDLLHPFSASKEVAKFIEDKQLNNMLIVGSRDLEVSPLAALLDRKIYYPESKSFGSFMKWNERQYVDVNTILAQVSTLVRQKDIKVLLILSNRNYSKKPDISIARPDISIAEIYQSSESIIPHESYRVYIVHSKLVND